MAAVEETAVIEEASASPPEEVDVAVIGSGFSGLGMAINLKREGIEDFIVLERDEEVGGTWWANTYPGCACDIPSHLYSYSFAPNPNWSETYSPQAEIRDYLHRCADEFGVRPHVRLGHAVTGAVWNEAEERWDIETSRGFLRARMLVAGMGPLCEPKLPDIPGLERFRGPVFHSARWDHSQDLTGKRVAAIGTGASAIQFVPEIQPRVEQLHVFQRTAPWVLPHSNRPITRLERRLYRAFPAAQRLVRATVYSMREAAVPGFVKNPRLLRVLERMARRHIRKQVHDPELRRKVTPNYSIGCKRILPSNKWYPALGEPNVELVTEGIGEVRESSIVTSDGVERPVDAIVLGTGFHVADMPVGRHVAGRDGHLLDDVWKGSPRAHLGTAVAGFPNFFLLLGPNTGLGHGSMVYMIESQIAHVMAALRTMKRSGAETVEVRPEVVDRGNEEIDRRMEPTVWNTGCASWYIDENGRNSTLWPSWTWRFRQQTGTFDPSEYRLEPARAEGPAVAA